MASIRQRRALPDDGGPVLATGRSARAASGAGVHPAAVVFFTVSCLFLFSLLSGGGGDASSPRPAGDDGTTSSLRGARAAPILVPGYTAASLKRYRKERRNLAVERTGYDPAEEGILDRHELKKYFDCARVNSKRPVIREDEWRYFRDLYNEFTALEALEWRNDTYKWNDRHIPSPVLGALTPDKGRGVVAARDVREGERVFAGTNNTIVYRTGDVWRKFLLHLYYAPPLDSHYEEGFACDIMNWSWNQEVDVGDAMTAVAIVVDLDASSLLNHPSHDETHNIQCGKPGGDGTCAMDYYAVRDIKKGEEILCEYGDFSSPQWHSFGL